MRLKIIILFLLFTGYFYRAQPLFADENTHHLSYNTLAVDFPFSGGAMLAYSKFWRLARYFDAGWVVAGGQIERDFDLKNTDGTTVNTTTKAWVLPMTG